MPLSFLWSELLSSSKENKSSIHVSSLNWCFVKTQEEECRCPLWCQKVLNSRTECFPCSCIQSTCMNERVNTSHVFWGVVMDPSCEIVCRVNFASRGTLIWTWCDFTPLDGGRRPNGGAAGGLFQRRCGGVTVTWCSKSTVLKIQAFIHLSRHVAWQWNVGVAEEWKHKEKSLKSGGWQNTKLKSGRYRWGCLKCCATL